jgi:energy-coupling factor transporter ATP-binding protein EcfA2
VIDTGVVLYSESDVEQKFVVPMLTTPAPHGFGYELSDFRTKVDIRRLSIDKGDKKKLYFPDYAVILDGIPALIIEAKLPGADLNEALREARLYALEINAFYPSGLNPCKKILATDGNVVVGCFWDQSQPYISLTRDNLNVLDPLLQKLTEFAGRKILREEVDDLIRSIRPNKKFIKPTQILGGKAVANEGVGENSFGVNVSIEYKYLFNPKTLKERSELVGNAYVTSKRKQAHIAPIDKIIRAAVPMHIVDARSIKNTGSPNEIIDELRTRKIQNEICLLVGSVGSGKSTFTDYLRLRALPKDVAGSTSWINVNLNVAPLSKDKVYDWIVGELTAELRKAHLDIDFDALAFLRTIYKEGLDKVDKGRAALYDRSSDKYADVVADAIKEFQADAVGTLSAVVNFLYRSNAKLLIIVFDNCDKRTRDDQLLMFDVASWLKSRLQCMVFLPLRDTTYDQYKSEPPLDTVIKDLVFRIDPPLLERVIYARLSYALREIQGDGNDFVYYLSNGMKVKCARSEVAEYLKAIIASLFQDHFFKRVITGLAGRNIRRGLEILLDFCKSGHIDESEILKIRSSSGAHPLPNHLISKILLKGKRRYYSDSESNIRNLFDSHEQDPFPNPFVRIAILRWLKIKRRDYGPNKTVGFHKVEELISSLQAAGFSAGRAMIELAELHRADCVISESQDSKMEKEDLISLAPAGLVHLDLLQNVNYLSTVAEDVIFAEEDVAKKVAYNLTGRSLFRVDSRQAAISNCKLLMGYMASYHDSRFLGDAKVLSEDVIADLVDLKSISDFVENVAINDQAFRELSQTQDDYPIGTQVDGQVVSVQNYGFFVEFGLRGRGLVHSSQFNHMNNDPANAIEAGDWVIVEILEFNPDHKRFGLRLIDR